MNAEQQDIRNTIDFAYDLKPEDLVWKPIYPNNILLGEIEGCYTLVLRKGSDGRISGRKYSIQFQKEEDPAHLGEGVLPPHAKTELYILFEKSYHDVVGPLDYPEPQAESSFSLDKTNREITFNHYDINDYGCFVRAYPTLELAKKRAVTQYQATFGHALSYLIADEEP